MRATTTHMAVGGRDYRQRLTLTIVPARVKRWKEIYCLTCTRKVIETYDELAIVSDAADSSNLVPEQPSIIGVPCKGTCHSWYEIKAMPGIFEVESTRIFFLDSERKHREVHCAKCKELFATVTTGRVFGVADPYRALMSDDGFVPTTCPNCSSDYDITTNA